MDDPSFYHPLVDGKTYHRLAMQLVTNWWTEKHLWQALFYPTFLVAWYKAFGVTAGSSSSIEFRKI